MGSADGPSHVPREGKNRDNEHPSLRDMSSSGRKTPMSYELSGPSFRQGLLRGLMDVEQTVFGNTAGNFPEDASQCLSNQLELFRFPRFLLPRSSIDNLDESSVIRLRERFVVVRFVDEIRGDYGSQEFSTDVSWLDVTLLNLNYGSDSSVLNYQKIWVTAPRCSPLFTGQKQGQTRVPAALAVVEHFT